MYRAVAKRRGSNAAMLRSGTLPAKRLNHAKLKFGVPKAFTKSFPRSLCALCALCVLCVKPSLFSCKNHANLKVGVPIAFPERQANWKSAPRRKEALTPRSTPSQYPLREIFYYLLALPGKRNSPLYMTAIWGKALSLDPSSPLPIIIPIVFYHGNRKWTISTDFDGLFETEKEHYGAYRRQIPSYEYLLYDFSSTKHEPIRGTKKLQIFLGITRAIFEEEKEVFIETVLDAMKVFDELRGTVGNEEYFEAYIRYLFYARTDFEQEELKERIKTVSMERSEKMLTIAEKLLQEGVEKGLAKGIKKGREEGRKEGREKGREEGREELLWKQITKKFPQIPERYYEKLKALTIDQLDTLGLDLIDMQNEEELKKHLPM